MYRNSWPAGAGFILADTGWNPLYANEEAKKIVTYPEGPRRFPSAWALMRKKIFSPTSEQNSWHLLLTWSSCPAGESTSVWPFLWLNGEDHPPRRQWRSCSNEAAQLHGLLLR